MAAERKVNPNVANQHLTAAVLMKAIYFFLILRD